MFQAALACYETDNVTIVTMKDPPPIISSIGDIAC